MRGALVLAAFVVCARSLACQCTLPSQPFFEFQVEIPARFLSDSTVSPQPKGEPGVRATQLPALVQFVVDTAGVPDPRSYRVLSARDPQLAADGLDALPRWRFSPARLGQCPVPQLVQTPLSR